MSIFTGSGVAIITPFKEDKAVDYDAFRKIIEFQIKNKTDAIIVCGTTGEASTLTTKEHIDVVKFCVDIVDKRVPVIAGAGNNNTKYSLEICEKCEKVGVDGLLIVTPYYNKTTQKGIINYYKTLAKDRKVPIIAYNVPSRTGLNIEPKTMLEISKIKNIVGIKEASGNISQVANIINLCDKEFFVYSGNDEQILPVLSLGGKGVISVFANIAPKQTHDMIEKFLQGEYETSRKIQLDAIDMINALFLETNPIPVKTALSLMGYAKNTVREPLVEMEKENYEILKDVMKMYKIIY